MRAKGVPLKSCVLWRGDGVGNKGASTGILRQGNSSFTWLYANLGDGRGKVAEGLGGTSHFVKSVVIQIGNALYAHTVVYCEKRRSDIIIQAGT